MASTSGRRVAERLVRLAAAELHPGQQDGLQHLHRAAAAHGLQPLLGPVPAPGLHIGAGQQQVGGRVVGQPAGQSQRLRPAIEQRRQEGAVQQFRLVGIGVQGVQQIIGRDLGISLRRGETADEVGPEGTGSPAIPGGDPAGGTGGEERGRQKDEPLRGTGELHRHSG